MEARLGAVRGHSQKLQNDLGGTRSRFAVILSEAKDVRSCLLSSAPRNEPRRFFASLRMARWVELWSSFAPSKNRSMPVIPAKAGIQPAR